MSLIHHEKTQITLDTETGLMWQDNIDADKLKLNWLEAQEYCKNLRLGGFTDWEIPNEDILLDLAKKSYLYGKQKLENVYYVAEYLATRINNNDKIQLVSFVSAKLSDPLVRGLYNIRCVRSKKIKHTEISEIFCFKRINENSITLFVENELYYLEYDNKEYFGFFHEILEKINLTQIKNSANISEIINQKLEEKIKEYLNIDKIQEPNFDLRIKDSFIKDEFETQIEFDERVNQFIEKQKKEYEQREIEYKNRIENLGDIKKDFLFEIFAQTMGVPILKDAFYDAETNDMYITLFMTNYFWEKRIKVNIQDRIVAKDFKTKLNEVKINATFDFENEEFIFDNAQVEFDNYKFTAVESKEQEKQEEIRLDFKLVPEETGLETSIDNQLSKYTLEVKTFDNQKLEDEIKTLKEQLGIIENRNQLLNEDKQTLLNQLLALKNSINLQNEKINEFTLKNKGLEEKYQNVINENQTLDTDLKELKDELENKKIEVENLNKSKLQLESSLKSRDSEILALKNSINLQNEKINEFALKNKGLEEKYHNILKDNQHLKYEIEELKRYCKELELNSFQNQEQQNSSKVVERESFSDF